MDRHTVTLRRNPSIHAGFRRDGLRQRTVTVTVRFRHILVTDAVPPPCLLERLTAVAALLHMLDADRVPFRLDPEALQPATKITSRLQRRTRLLRSHIPPPGTEGRVLLRADRCDQVCGVQFLDVRERDIAAPQ